MYSFMNVLGQGQYVCSVSETVMTCRKYQGDQDSRRDLHPDGVT